MSVLVRRMDFLAVLRRSFCRIVLVVVCQKGLLAVHKWSFCRTMLARMHHVGLASRGARDGRVAVSPIPSPFPLPALAARHAGGHGRVHGNHEKPYASAAGRMSGKRCDDAATRGCSTRLQSVMVVLE